MQVGWIRAHMFIDLLIEWKQNHCSTFNNLNFASSFLASKSSSTQNCQAQSQLLKLTKLIIYSSIQLHVSNTLIPNWDARFSWIASLLKSTVSYIFATNS